MIIVGCLAAGYLQSSQKISSLSQYRLGLGGKVHQEFECLPTPCRKNNLNQRRAQKVKIKMNDVVQRVRTRLSPAARHESGQPSREVKADQLMRHNKYRESPVELEEISRSNASALKYKGGIKVPSSMAQESDSGLQKHRSRRVEFSSNQRRPVQFDEFHCLTTEPDVS